MYKVTVRQNNDCITYKEETLEGIEPLMQALLFNDHGISITVEAEDNE